MTTPSPKQCLKLRKMDEESQLASQSVVNEIMGNMVAKFYQSPLQNIMLALKKLQQLVNGLPDLSFLSKKR